MTTVDAASERHEPVIERTGRRVSVIATTRAWIVAAAVAYGALAAVLLSPGLTIGPSLDAAVFAVGARELRLGARLYADVWDHKPPGIFLADAAAQSLLPFTDPWLPLWILSVVSVALTGVGVALLARRHDVQRWVLVGLLTTVGLSVHPIAVGGGLTETIAAWPAIMALLSATSWIAPHRYLICGALVSVAILISFWAAIVAPIAFVLTYRSFRSFLREAAIFATGAALPIVIVAGWLIAQDLGSSFWSAVIEYNRAYVELNRASPGHSTWAIVLGIPSLAFLIVPALLGLGTTLGERRRRRWYLAMMVWLASAIAAIILQSRLAPHYLTLVIPPLAALAVEGFFLPPRASERLLALSRALVAVSAALSVVALMRWDAIVTRTHSVQADKEVARWVDERSQPADRIFVWGSKPQIYLWSERRPAGRFIYFYPLTTPGYSGDAQIQELLASLQRIRPVAVIDASWTSVPLLVPHDLASGDRRDYDGLDRVRAWIRANYTQAGMVAGYRVYWLSSQEGS